jgi:hypothetical protein
MNRPRFAIAACVVGIGLSVPPLPSAAHGKAAAAAASLWEPPQGGHERDLLNGPWGAKMAPDPTDVYTFVHRKRDGVNPGLVVTDSRGRTWHVKQPRNGPGDEGPVEVTLSRILSAIGYHQPPVYYLPDFTLRNGSRTHVVRGGRFRLSDPRVKSRGEWAWTSNPFVDTQPYNGLLVALLVFKSWDLKDSNNRIYDVVRGGRVEQWYVVRDLGGALGDDTGLSPKRNHLERFERTRFIRDVSDGFVKFAYHGKNSELFDERLTPDDVRWACQLLANLDDRQWRDAFRAGGYEDAAASRFIRKIHANISDGLRVTNHRWRAADDRR